MSAYILPTCCHYSGPIHIIPVSTNILPAHSHGSTLFQEIPFTIYVLPTCLHSSTCIHIVPITVYILPTCCHNCVSCKIIPVSVYKLPACYILTICINKIPIITILAPISYDACNRILIILVCKIQIHISRYTRNSGCRATLPYTSFNICIIMRIISCNPQFLSCNLAYIYVVLIPVLIAINHRSVTISPDFITKCFCNSTKLRLRQIFLRRILQINSYRI